MIAASKLADISEQSERAFLVATARRVAHGQGRKTARWELNDDMDQWTSDAGRGEERDLQLCDLALSKLNPELAETFVLHEIEGHSGPEIASLLGIPLGSVASRLRRGREQFRGAVARIEHNLKRIARLR